ncbi:MAG: hypothetical protein WC091_20345 [Sulfuricellaceae bacterium]
MEESVKQQFLDAINEIGKHPSRLADAEPYLLEPLGSGCQGDILDNADYRIEDLSDDDLDVSTHVA